ncbi:MAG TPA: non-canonical purine NTP pyrophosphatase, partial [Dehalococcoidia bacterium]|nr:non-canonical purine NTP pyrophosphatase [Dehalococcoidia bacterium]
MAPDTSILLATSNPAKLDKLRWVLEGLPLICVPLSQFPDQPQPEESGQTFKENARLKASQGSEL